MLTKWGDAAVPVQPESRPKEVIPSNPSGNRLLSQVVKKGSYAAAASV